MPFEILHFRGSDKIIKDKNLENDIQSTLEYVMMCFAGQFIAGSFSERHWRRRSGEETGMLS